MSEDIQRAIGKLEGCLKGISKEQGRQNTVLEGIDTRLGNIEKQSAKYGLISGGIAGIFILVGGEFIKKKLGM